MEHSEMVELLRGGVAERGGVWADFGAGAGNFTRALAELLGAAATIYAIDRDGAALAQQRAAASAYTSQIQPIQSDLRRPLDLPALDGALMANVLHFLPDQAAALALVAGYLRPGARLLLVEYERAHALPWVPFPVPCARFLQLAEQAGLRPAAQMATRRSPSGGGVMYAAYALRP